MRNILATSAGPRRFAGLSPAALVLAGSIVVALLWGAWATREILALEAREVVSVELGAIIGEFVEAEARSGRAPEDSQARTLAYLKALEASVAALGRQGRTVLVAEAVVAGSVRDLTTEVRAEVARRLRTPMRAEMGALGRASR